MRSSLRRNKSRPRRKRANEFFDKCFDENVARHPQFASSLGLKTDYDKWDDLSDAANAANLAFALQNHAERGG